MALVSDILTVADTELLNNVDAAKSHPGVVLHSEASSATALDFPAARVEEHAMNSLPSPHNC